jgi:chromatin structure-remodeling complex subunit RSC9
MFSRATSSPQASPAPPQQHQHNSSSDPRNANFTIDKYQPKQPMAMALRPVVTPGNSPEMFRQRVAVARANAFPRQAPQPQQALKHIPGGGCLPDFNQCMLTSVVVMRGPNIYIRCLYGLRSEIPDEQDFALHHLVKVSFERGDKYKFEGFPQLAESLLEKALEISTLIHGIKWSVSYEEDAGLEDGDVLNASFGTDGLYERLQTLPILADEDFLEPAEFSHKLVKLNEAALVIRNMVMLEENALFISKFSLLRDFLIIALNLPQQERLSEYCQYALEIVEQLTKYWELDSTSPIYQSLVGKLTSEDRGVVLSSARAIARIGMESPRANRLTDIPVLTIRKLASYLLLDSDDELMLAALDLLYQYTALQENMTFLLTSDPAIIRRIAPRLISLVLHNAQAHEQKIKIKDVQRLPPVTNIPVVPDDLYNELLGYPEPDRSNRWLKCCFEEAPTEDITQIAIWQAYQGRFQNNAPIPAADFIKNVSGTFTTAQAQVINGPNPRFIIKGIRPKRVVVNLKGEPYHKCLWQIHVANQNAQPLLSPPEPQSCGLWYFTPEALWTHLVKDHLSIPRKDDGKFEAEAQGSYQCRWLGCTKHTIMMETSARAAGVHVRLHVGNSSKAPSADAATGRSSDIVKDAEYISHTYYTTLVDEKGLPAGIPYMAVLVLKNFARHAVRKQQSGQTKEVLVVEDLFGELKDQLWNSFTLHRTLRADLDHLISMVYKASGERGSNIDRGGTSNGDMP